MVGTSDINGKTYDATGSSPIQGVHVIAEYPGGGPAVGSTNSDANGNFMIAGLAPGTYMLAFSRAHYVYSYWHDKTPTRIDNVITRTAGQTGYVGIQHVVAGANISGTVTNKQGSPVAGTASLCNRGPTDDCTTALEQVPIGDDGSYSFQDLAVGAYHVGFTTDPSGIDDNCALQPSDPYVSQWLHGSYNWGTAATVNVTFAGQVSSGNSVVMENPTFADMSDPTNAFYTYVQWMSATGISTGTPQPSGKPLYKPVDAVSRQAMAAFLYRLAHLP